MYRFLLSPRWVGLALFVVIFGAVCGRLGLWQWHRHDERAIESARIVEVLDDDPVPLARVLDGSDEVPDDAEWTPVTVTGDYDVSNEAVVKYRTRDQPGVDVVTPLVLDDGTGVLIDRGWMPAANTTERPDVEPPPTGEVTVTGWLRVDSGADDAAIVPDEGQVRAVSSEGFAETVPYDLSPGYLDLRTQSPEGDLLALEPEPDTGQGPHFFYALQWWFFGLLGPVGYAYFAWSEAHPKRPRRRLGGGEDVPDELDADPAGPGTPRGVAGTRTDGDAVRPG